MLRLTVTLNRCQEDLTNIFYNSNFVKLKIIYIFDESKTTNQKEKENEKRLEGKITDK